MRVRHPRDRTPSNVDVDGTSVTVDDDGTFELPEGTRRGWLDRFAAVYDATPDQLVVRDTCQAVKSDGDVCGRLKPCRYHDDE